MDNKAIATVLYETADLLEIDAQDSFRIRSYRNAAQAIENLTEQIKDMIGEPKKVLAIPGIGKGMLDQPTGAVQRRQPQRASRTAQEVSSFDAAIAEDPGPGTEDNCADLERLPGLRRRWRGKAGARRQDPRSSRAWARSTNKNC